MTANVERDAPVRWVEPFAGMYWRIRTLTLVAGVALLVILVQSFWLYRLSAGSAAHVYEIRPDGETVYVGSRHANLEPRPKEMLFTAKRFVALLYQWNSSRIAEDFAAAVTMCSAEMGQQLREDLASVKALSQIQDRQIRSEVSFGAVRLVESTRTHARVLLAGTISIYPLSQYDGEPQQTRDFSLEVTLGVVYQGGMVYRDPETRPAGLEVVRLIEKSREAG